MDKRFLIVGENDNDYSALSQFLLEAGYTPDNFITCNDIFLQNPGEVYIILSEDGFSADNSLTLDNLKSKFPDIKIILLKNMPENNTAINAIVNDVAVNNIAGENMHNEVPGTTIGKNGYQQNFQSDTSEYKDFFKDNPNALWIYDPNTLNFLAVNKAAITLYGYTEDEFLGMTIKNIRLPEDALLLEKSNQMYRSDGFFDAGEWQHIKKNGEIIHVKIFSRPANFKGKPARFVQAMDITASVITTEQNRELHQAIKKQKEQYEDILKAIDEVVWSCTAKDCKVLFMNDISKKAYGYTPEEFINNSNKLFEIVHDEDKEYYTEVLKTLPKNGYANFDYRIVHKDGTIRYIINQAHYRKGINDEPDTITGLAVDVTRTRLVEEELIEKVDEVENILESISEAFMTVDNNWDFTYINKSAEHFYKRKREDLLHKNLWKEFKDATKYKFYTEYHKAVKEQISVSFEEYAPAIKGWVSVKAYPIKNGLAIYISDITEEKKLLSKIATDERNLRALINNTNDFIWSVDNNLKIISINKAYRSHFAGITGSKPETGDLIIIDSWSTDTKKVWLDRYKKALAGVRFSVVDEELANNEICSRETRFNPILDDERKVIGVSCFARDISEEIKLQEKAIADERNLWAIINNTSDIIWSIDKEHQIVSANQAFSDRAALLTNKKNLTQLDKDDFSEQRFIKWREYATRALNGERYKIIEQDNINGKAVYEEISFNPIYNENEDVVGVSCFSRDITEEKNMQDKILKDEQNLRALINNTNDFIWSVDRDLNIISINKPFSEFIYAATGKMPSPKQSIITDDFGGEIKERWLARYAQVLNGIAYHTVDEELINNTIHYTDLKIHSIYDNNGKVIGASCFARDISEERGRQIRIEEQNERLKEIAWIQSHKVRGPVASILGLANLFNYQDPNDPINLEILEGLKTATSTLDKVIREVVDKTSITDFT